MFKGHGGNLAEVEARFGWPPETVLDLSASLNPLGPPPAVHRVLREGALAVRTYPDPQCRRLRERLARVHGVPPEQVLVGNGATELIYLLPRALKARRVLVCLPTYQDYAEAARAAGAEVKSCGPALEEPSRWEALKEACGPDPGGCADLVFLCNPNNPTGSLVSPQRIRELASAHPGTAFAVDEAYADFADDPGLTLLSAPLPENVVVLRSFTKIYRIPGLRLGYAVGPRPWIARMEELKEPWAVNGLALAAGEALLGEQGFVAETRSWMRENRAALVRDLSAIPGLEVMPSSVNFLLLRLPPAWEADRLRDVLLARHRILVRSCANFQGLGNRHIRVAVGLPQDNDRLVKALGEVLG